MSTSGLDSFRTRIDDLDRQIMALLADRLQVCAEVAAYKKQHAIPMMQPDRVEAVKSRCAALGASRGLRGDFVKDLYGCIIGEACRLEDEIIGARDGVSDTDRANV
jgi:chorismate mutase-like protein